MGAAGDDQIVSIAGISHRASSSVTPRWGALAPVMATMTCRSSQTTTMFGEDGTFRWREKRPMSIVAFTVWGWN